MFHIIKRGGPMTSQTQPTLFVPIWEHWGYRKPPSNRIVTIRIYRAHYVAYIITTSNIPFTIYQM